jgi:hypothetical protein
LVARKAAQRAGTMVESLDIAKVAMWVEMSVVEMAPTRVENLAETMDALMVAP